MKSERMDNQDDRPRTFVSHRKLHGESAVPSGRPSNAGSRSEDRTGSRQQRTISTVLVGGDNAGRINPGLQWEKVPVIANNRVKIITAGRVNGPTFDSPTEVGWRLEGSPVANSPDRQSREQQSARPQKVIRVPMFIESPPKVESPDGNADLPVVSATVSHNFEVVHAALVRPGLPLGSYASHTFTVDESEMRDFNPFTKRDSILSSLDLDVTRLKRIYSDSGQAGPSESPQGRETTHRPPDNDDNIEILIDDPPHQRLQTLEQHKQQHRTQHALSPSKSSVSDLKSGGLFRKPSIRRKSNPLAAFLASGSKEVKKSSKGKSPSTGGLPSGLRIRERGSSLTRYPVDSKSRLDQLIGSGTSDPLSDAWTEYIENTYDKFDVVLRKEEEGYGIQFRGQYPVVVDHVRPGGGADKNGIMKGDIIFKINGNLVVKQSHEKVISCFKNAGPFMGMTLLRAPQSGLDDEAKGNNITSLFAQSDKISNPGPAARDKNLELERERQMTLKSMYDKAVSELEQLRSEAQKTPNDVMLMKCENQAKVVSQLEKRLSALDLSFVQPSVTAVATQGDGISAGYSHSSLPKLPLHEFRSSPFNFQSTEIMSIEGLDCADDDDNEAFMQHREFEDLNLLMQSAPHMACFLKYLIHNSNPNCMLFNMVATCYMQSSLKDTAQSARWAFEIYLAFLLDTSPLALRLHPNITKYVESCIGSGRDMKVVFLPAVTSVQDQLVRQLEEFQHQRTLGLGNFFGEEYLPKPKARISASSSFTAPVSYHTSPKPPLSHAHSSSSSPSVTPVPPMTSVPRSGNNLSSSSFSSHSKSSSSGTSDQYAVEKILWDVFASCLGRDDDDAWRVDETRPAVAASLATFFRHQGASLSRQNQLLLEGVASFVWRDKKALKAKLKGHAMVNGHDFVPHLCNLLHTPGCSLCSNVLWGAGHQGYKCQSCDMLLHKGCMKLNTVPLCSKVPCKPKSGRDEATSTFYTSESYFNSLPLRKKRRDDSTGTVLSDTESLNAFDGDSISSPIGSNTPLILSHASGPNIHQQSSQDIPDSDMEVEQDLPPLSKVIPEDALSQLVAVARKKQEIINELFYTERSHVKSLLIIIHFYLRPMRSDPRIDQQLVEMLFPNLDSITQWHKELSSEFKLRRKEQPVVQEVGDILMRRFSGPIGMRLQEQCAEFCKNQLVNLELLKNKQRQDAYLNHFILSTAQKDICKKQDLKDSLPKVMQRLTKYPLLFENLLKVTPAGTEEHAKLLRALKNVKMILACVNETVRENENHRVLLDMQKRMDTRHLENVQHPVLDEFRNLQLTDRKLRHYGHLTWNASASKNVELLLALFEDLLIIFQDRDSRLVLKCEMHGADMAKFIFAPILKLGNLLVKVAPRTTRTFYLINASKESSQMYSLTAKTREEREKWMKQIMDTIEDYKKKHSQPLTPPSPKPSVLTETSPCYEVTEPEPVELGNQETNHEASGDHGQTDVIDGAKEEVDDDELTNTLSPAVYNPEKELKRQIIVTHELMMDKVKALSELHHIESPNFDLSEKTLPLDTDSESFICTMDNVIDGMTNFFTSLPDVVIDNSREDDRPQEWDPVESLLELGQRLEMLVRQLEELVLQNNSGLGTPPPLPTSEPPPLDFASRGANDTPGHSGSYVERNF